MLAITVAGFAVAFKRDLGGIRSVLEEGSARIKLLVQGLAQPLQEDGFSGAVMEELNRKENAGVKQFAIRVFQAVFRVQRFLEELAEGFAPAIERARPAFESFTGALRQLGEAFGVVGTVGADAIVAVGSDRFVRAGATIGDVLVRVVTVFVDGLSIVVRVVTFVIRGGTEAFDIVRLVFEFLGEVIGWVAGIIGGVPASAVGVVALALRSAIAIVRGVIQAFEWLVDTNAHVVGRVGRLAVGTPSPFGPAFLDGLDGPPAGAPGSAGEPTRAWASGG